MPTFESMRKGYGNLWRKATIKPGADDTLASTFAQKIVAAEERYRAVQAATGVPWFFVGALHMREASCDVAGVLHNGERIIGTGRLTSLEPPNRGPFASWDESAIDALKLKNLHRVQAWSIERMLYHAEEYNGWGYVGKGVNSAYVWAGTSLEQLGKYTADHDWSSSFDDPQIGVACVLKRLAELRPDIAAAIAGSTAGAAGTVAPPAANLPEVLAPSAPDIAGLLRPFAPLVLYLLVKDSLPAEQRDALLQKVLAQTLGATLPVTLPAAETAAPAAPAATAPAAPVTTAPAATAGNVTAAKPSVWLSIASLSAALLGMDQGVLGTPFGMGADPSAAGTLAVLAPLTTAAIGATGGFAPLVRAGIGILGALASAAAAKQPK